MATATSSPTCQFLTHFGSPRPHPIIFSPIAKQTHFQPYRIIANGSLRNNYYSPTPTISSNSPLLVKAQASINGEREPMVPPYNVLITGSSKGIGYALAKKFLIAGDNVIICSRSAERLESAVNNLREEYGERRVWGTQCDVREAESVKNLVLFAQKNLGYIDIWINNAGSNAYSYKPLAEASDEDLIEVVSTNTLGLMICCREVKANPHFSCLDCFSSVLMHIVVSQAIKMMLQQPRGGHIFNIDGAGSDGRPTPRFAAYGATKRSAVHLTKSLQAELQMQDVKNVVVHNLSPGMVTTDLLMSGATTKQAKFFINVLAEPAEVVADYLVPNIRSIPASGSWKPTYIRFLTGLKAYSQIFSMFTYFMCFWAALMMQRLAFGARRNRYVLED
ncbi:Chlorophyll (ide) b reductase NOL, chloroplastic-like protein [Gossypium australe]|uniref:Chlorophyll (Ide) b reductase NOL, chloroplastic-like protein n=1 Tax=Gossypium australe TaxID=47621 RepID=A0A5B6WI90_9ROSI|nr:Chlorophyll (ide) b reductase NOL, chloroplastic-like protein [Gossypium australe]